MLARRKRVVRMRVAQLGDAADVAGVELGNLDALLTLRDREVVQLLGATARDVVQLVAVGDRAGEEPEEGDVTDVWLCFFMIRRGQRWTLDRAAAAAGVYKSRAVAGVELFHFIRVQ